MPIVGEDSAAMVAPRVIIVAAQARNRVIGAGGDIPWRIKGEQRWFRAATENGVVVMGRRTWQSLPSALPNRRTVMLSRGAVEPGIDVRPTLTGALALAAEWGASDVFIAGGAAVYAEAMPLAAALYLTDIELTVPGDTFMAVVPPGFTEVWRRRVEGDVPHTFRTLVSAGLVSRAIVLDDEFGFLGWTDDGGDRA